MPISSEQQGPENKNSLTPKGGTRSTAALARTQKEKQRDVEQQQKVPKMAVADKRAWGPPLPLHFRNDTPAITFR
jgi:alkylated DNA repair dioxygenase AlkB